MDRAGDGDTWALALFHHCAFPGRGVSPCSSGLVPVSRLVLPHVRSPRCGLIEGGMGPKAEPGAQRGEAAPQGL